MAKMIAKNIVLLLLIAGANFLASCSGKEIEQLAISSPDGNIGVVFKVYNEKSNSNSINYAVSYKGKSIIQNSGLGIEFANAGKLEKEIRITGIKKDSENSTYANTLGKRKEVKNHFNQVSISLQERNPPHRKMNVIFRVYSDGVAFRYFLPKQKGLEQCIITNENSQFCFISNPTVYALQLDSYTTSYEKNYDVLALGDIAANAVIGMPLLAEIEDGPFVVITEADLLDYAGMYLSKVPHDSLSLVSNLSPLPKKSEIKVVTQTPRSTPWRVIMIAEDPGRLIESDIVRNLSTPCKIQDVSWIKPGKSAWSWWSGDYAERVKFKPGMNTETMKYYTDFAADTKLEYLLIDAGWYGSSRSDSADITVTIPEINIPEIVKYARERGVDVMLWIRWQYVNNQMDKAFPLYEKWGIKGVKIDYMERDDQEMVNFYERVLKKAAEHHLIVDFHGAYKPTGLERTYPNLLTREGVLGLEYSKWSDKCNPDHEVTIPFTRMLAGPMDFTPGAFRTATKEQFKPKRIAPVAMGTRCHQIAMYVVYESPLQMLVDYPSAYKNQTGIEFLKAVPTVWDETKVINAKVGDYITIARKHGNSWYVGSMNDWNPIKLTIPLDFLGMGNWKADIYADAPDADRNPTHVKNSKFLVTASDKIIAPLAPGGGHAMIISPAPEGASLPHYQEP